MISGKNVANAVGGKTARACDSCIKKRARWYCASDDAFLCQACDSSVHSANPLARRHERVRLKTASFKSPKNAQSVPDNNDSDSVPSWHKGITRKARTPRYGKLKTGRSTRNNTLPLVPEIGSDDTSHEENNEEDQLLYRVPIFDPFSVELCTSANSTEEEKTADQDHHANGSESKPAIKTGYNRDVDSLHGFLPSDMELAEFAADVESLLGRDFENESSAMEELGLVDYTEKEFKEGSRKVKLEEEEEEEDRVEAAVRDDQIDLEREPFVLNFDYDSPATCEDENQKVIKGERTMEINVEENDNGANKKREKMLRLDYGSVITAWASQGSPWTTGDRPEVDPDEYWPCCTKRINITHMQPELVNILGW
ncbi:CONSTANS-like zinc finger protein [Melia azedarach]|uniref:CONSTANS-like zinc finger protein n=1 Tax=Melia azedarach TaxID=155640 RepID=A0ACC1XGK3_MELAZ|nr:CONSTANS-like zinc finger protein [Melia azedarach]